MSERVAIVGGRDFPFLDAVQAYVNSLPLDTQIVSGGAGGVDTTAEAQAKARGMPEPLILRPHYDGKVHPKMAPKVRNWQIAAACDRLVAFWDGMSGGTAHVIACAVALGKPVRVEQEHLIAMADAEARTHN